MCAERHRVGHVVLLSVKMERNNSHIHVHNTALQIVYSNISDTQETTAIVSVIALMTVSDTYSKHYDTMRYH